jgi:hypothetical protein
LATASTTISSRSRQPLELPRAAGEAGRAVVDTWRRINRASVEETKLIETEAPGGWRRSARLKSAGATRKRRSEMPTIVLRVNRDPHDDMQYFVVDIDAPFAAELLALIASLRVARRRHRIVQTVGCHDQTGGAYCSAEVIPQELQDAIEDCPDDSREFAVAPDGPALFAAAKAAEPRVDYRGINIYDVEGDGRRANEGYVSFVVEPHMVSDAMMLFETTVLWEKVLLQIANGKSVDEG